MEINTNLNIIKNNENNEIGNYRKPINKNFFNSEKDKEFFLNEKLEYSKILKKSIILYNITKNISKENQDYEQLLELKLKKKYNYCL
jgi:hypothetical protein